MSIMTTFAMAIKNKKISVTDILSVMVRNGITVSEILMECSNSITCIEKNVELQIEKVESEVKNLKKQTNTRKKVSVKELKEQISEKYGIPKKLLKYKKKELERMLETGENLPTVEKSTTETTSQSLKDTNDINPNLKSIYSIKLNKGTIYTSKQLPEHVNNNCKSMATKGECKSKNTEENGFCKKCNKYVKITKSGNIEFDTELDKFYFDAKMKRPCFDKNGNLVNPMKQKIRAYLKDGKNYDLHGIQNNPYYVYTKQDAQNNFESWTYICMGSPFKNNINDYTWVYEKEELQKTEQYIDPDIQDNEKKILNSIHNNNLDIECFDDDNDFDIFSDTE